MAMHDWTRVTSGIFHHFHHDWITTIASTLNSGLLPEDYYALAEQQAEGPIPDVLALECADEDDAASSYSEGGSGGLALAESPPKVRYTLEAEQAIYAAKASRVAVYHATGDRVVAYVEIVSPGNKQSEAAVRKLLDKLSEAIQRGCHLLVIDPHLPTPRDRRGLHFRFWKDYFGQSDSPGVNEVQPLGLMAYRSDLVPTAYFEPLGVGEPIPELPLFFTRDKYVNVPLEATYQQAFEGVPRRWKRVIEQPQE